MPSLATVSSSPQELLETIMEVSLSGINLLRPIYDTDPHQLIDFEIEYVNQTGLHLLGFKEQPKGLVTVAFPSIQTNGVLDFYKKVYSSGQADQFKLNYQADGLDNYFYLVAKPQGSLLVVSFTDTSNQDRGEVEIALRESRIREKEARAEADLQHQQLENIFRDAPALICIFEGPQHIFKLVNPPYQQLVGNRPILGKPIAEAMPELTGQPIFPLLDDVYRTGKSFYAHEMMVQLDHENRGGELGQNYYNFIYQATHNVAGEINGILVFAYEVTEQVRTRHQVEKLNQELEARVLTRTLSLQKARVEADQQRELLYQLFMEAPAPIAILEGSSFIYRLVNPAYQQIFPGRMLLGKTLIEALPELKGTPIPNILQEVYESGETFVAEELSLMLARYDGAALEEIYFNFTYQARSNTKGEIDGVLVYAHDLTEQVRARKVVEANARQLQLITDALPVLIGYLDKQERYQFANKAYEPWFNQNPSHLLGRKVREVVGEKAYQGIKGYIDRALAGERIDFEAQMLYRENFIKHIRTSYIPDLQEGELVGFYTLVSDITEQVEARQAIEESERKALSLAAELARANEELWVANQDIKSINEELGLANQQLIRTNIDLDNFIYTASHDLKAPILNIEGLIAILLEDLPPVILEDPGTSHIFKLILEAVKRFKITITHLADITKLQKDHSDTQTYVNLAAVIEDVQLDLAPHITATKAQIEVNVSACPSFQYSVKNLRSIIYNLLSNAIKYHAPDRLPLVQVSYQEAGAYYVLLVQDNGLGMDLSPGNKLFTMFSRLHSHVEGTGIGLYMVKKIVENAKGKIEVESKVGEGSTFKVYFKINKR